MANDGGPAFPSPDVFNSNGLIINGYPGMTLRDYFAAAALNGFILDDEDASFEEYAVRSYMMADAILAARDSAVEPSV